MNTFIRPLFACVVLLFATEVLPAETAPFGIHVRTEPLQRIDSTSDQFLPGFLVETPAGTIRTLPSANRIEFTPTGSEKPTVLNAEVPTRTPSGIAFDDQHVWVADTGNRRILRWTMERDTINPESAIVLNTPALRRPVGLQATGGELFVSDSWSDQILVLDEAGRVLRTIGQHGYQPGFLSGPVGLLVHDDLLFVADSRNSRVQAFDPSTGTFVYEWGLHVIRPHEGEGRLHYPTKLLLSNDGQEIGVTEPWEDRVQWFRRATDSETVPERLPLGADNFVHFGAGVEAYDRLIAITDPDTHTVRVFDLSLDTPVLIGVIGEFGELPSQFAHPVDVSFLSPSEDRPLRLAVVDRGNARIAIYALDWSPDESLRFRPKLASLVRTLNLLALPGERPHPVDPVAIVACPDDTLALVDANNGNLMRLNDRLRLLHETDLKSEDSERPNVWTSVTLTPDGEIAVLDSANGRLVRCIPDGTSELDLDPTLEHATDLVVRRQDMLVVDENLHAIVRCDPSGEVVEYIGRSGLGAGEFFKPAAILDLPDGRVLIVDRGNHRLQFFDTDWNLSVVDGPRLYIADAKRGGRATVNDTPPAETEPITD